ncbi:MAG: hypothetical protein ACI9CD_000716 [Candidatus Deianiraeaceae bacterium]|jgi:hypothetical protein
MMLVKIIVFIKCVKYIAKYAFALLSDGGLKNIDVQYLYIQNKNEFLNLINKVLI